MTTILSSWIQQRMSALESANNRLTRERDASVEEAAERTAERDQARGMVADLEAQLAAAEAALIVEAREAHQHARTLRTRQGEPAAKIAYGQALGSEAALAEFLTVVAWDDDPDYPDPLDCARAYAEGRNPWETP